MPWISQELCTGCESCISECCVDAISMQGNVAVIDNDECIRCGVCHDVCPNDAIRHDSEKIPDDVASNMAWVHQLLAHEYYANSQIEQKHLIQRLVRHFDKDKIVAEKTLAQLAVLQQTAYPD